MDADIAGAPVKATEEVEEMSHALVVTMDSVTLAADLDTSRETAEVRARHIKARSRETRIRGRGINCATPCAVADRTKRSGGPDRHGK